MSADQNRGLHGMNGMVHLVPEAQGSRLGLSLYVIELSPGAHRRMVDPGMPNP